METVGQEIHWSVFLVQVNVKLLYSTLDLNIFKEWRSEKIYIHSIEMIEKIIDNMHNKPV